MHKSNLSDGSTIDINIKIENFPTAIIELEIELKFNNWNITTASSVHLYRTEMRWSSVTALAVLSMFLITASHNTT